MLLTLTYSTKPIEISLMWYKNHKVLWDEVDILEKKPKRESTGSKRHLLSPAYENVISQMRKDVLMLSFFLGLYYNFIHCIFVVTYFFVLSNAFRNIHVNLSRTGCLEVSYKMYLIPGDLILG